MSSIAPRPDNLIPIPTVCGSSIDISQIGSPRTVSSRPRPSQVVIDDPPGQLVGPSSGFLCRCATGAVFSAAACISFGVTMKLTTNQPDDVNFRTVSSFAGLLLGGCGLGITLMAGLVAVFVRRQRNSNTLSRNANNFEITQTTRHL